MSTPNRRDYVFAMLPPWMREAYNNDPLINEAIKSALRDGADSAGEVALRVCKVMHEHGKAMQDAALKAAREGTVIVKTKTRAAL
jgi:hypothetical protein